MGVSWVQNKTAVSVGNVTSLTCTFTNAVNAGDLLVCCGIAGATSTDVTCSDNVNGAWTAISGASSGAVVLFYLANSKAAAAGGLTVTVTDTIEAANRIRICMDEFSGFSEVSPIQDQSTAGSQTGTSLSLTGPTAQGNELVYFALGAATGTTVVTFTPGTINGVTATLGGSNTGSNGSIASQYVLSSVQGAQTATMTTNDSISYTMVLATFFAGTNAYQLGQMGVGY